MFFLQANTAAASDRYNYEKPEMLIGVEQKPAKA